VTKYFEYTTLDNLVEINILIDRTGGSDYQIKGRNFKSQFHGYDHRHLWLP
jgi:hypothetical protein